LDSDNFDINTSQLTLSTMPADRSQKQQYKKRPQNQNRDGANAAAGPSERKHKVPTLQARDGLMGVSKIKGQIRQTKRLLAKVRERLLL
jgi:hypothetical protein